SRRGPAVRAAPTAAARRAQRRGRSARRPAARRGRRRAAPAAGTPAGGAGPAVLPRPVRGRDRRGHGHQPGRGQEPRRAGHGRPAGRAGGGNIRTDEEELRRILADEAGSVEVAPDALPTIRARIARRRARHRPRWWGPLTFTGGTAVVAAAAVAFALVHAPK